MIKVATSIYSTYRTITSVSLRLALPFLILLATVIAGSQHAAAFEPTKYADNSKLAEGKWAKVSVTETGMHLITTAQLRNMGFSDPSKVHIYGYGGARISDILTENNYIDDLPQVPVVRTDAGILFYAVGPVSDALRSGVNYIPAPNPFSFKGYYYLSDREDSDLEISTIGKPSASAPATTFVEHIYHQQELVMLGPTGHQTGGEDFRLTPSRTFKFTLTDLAEPNAWLACSFAHDSSASTPARLTFTANGNTLSTSGTDQLAATSTDHGNYRATVTTKNFSTDSENLEIGITYTPGGTVSDARLDYLAINYTRRLRLADNQIRFSISSTQGLLDGATHGTTRLWDVTNPQAIYEINTGSSGSGIAWTNEYIGTRQYIAFNPNSTSFYTPTIEGNVANQNLHALSTPDMVIFSPSLWLDQAERIADMHRTGDSMEVVVINQDQVFEEFASGCRDVNAFRKMLKMLYDRGQSGNGRQLKYCLFFGRGSYDNRGISPTIAKNIDSLMPLWQSDQGMTDIDSFTTDDIFSFLRDGAGANMATDYLCIAVGRMPVSSSSMAKAAVDKLIKYNNDMPSGTWRNRALLLADDVDAGIHAIQMESLEKNINDSNGGSDSQLSKIYLESYDLIGGQYPEAHDDMLKTLSDGVAWWVFIGHGNPTELTHERLLTLNDIENMYLRRYPIFYGATCDFLRWDGDDTSAGELLWLHDDGGCIAQISANRPVYISDNGYLTNALGKFIFARDKNGDRYTLGEIYRNTKNNSRVNTSGMMTADANKLRYILMGDPAMKVVSPQRQIAIDRINGIAPDDEVEQAILMARQNAIIEGRVLDAEGNTDSSFDGIISSTLYDAEYSSTIEGDGTRPYPITFENHGLRLYAGNDSVSHGEFKVKIAMPSDIANNFRPATLSLVAKNQSGNMVDYYAGAVERRLYVYGKDETTTDTIAPIIKAMYLNHPNFSNGDFVNADPMLIAEVSDNTGINMSLSGIGRQMIATLDEKTTYSDVVDYYTPSASTSGSGTIAYPLSGLSEGLHTLRLRVWDTADNAASQTIEFYVSPEQAPVLYDVYTDVNPAINDVNFYLSHDRPDATIQVTVTVFNMLGSEVWSSTSTGRSEMYLSAPLNWDLQNNAGQRVGRGIYLYRATVVENGQESNTRVRRLAVAGN